MTKRNYVPISTAKRNAFFASREGKIYLALRNVAWSDGVRSYHFKLYFRHYTNNGTFLPGWLYTAALHECRHYGIA